MPKPPPGGWPDEKARLDAIAKWQEERQKRTDAEQEQRYKETESIVLGIFSKRGLRLIAGIILILFGLFMIVGAVGDMCSPPSGLPLAANIAILIFAGILPLAGGIALCVRDVKKRRKPKAKYQIGIEGKEELFKSGLRRQPKRWLLIGMFLLILTIILIQVFKITITAVDYNNRGMKALNNNNYNEAITDFNQSIKLDPSLAVAFSLL